MDSNYNLGGLTNRMKARLKDAEYDETDIVQFLNDAYFEILDKQYDGRIVILYHDKITYLEKDGEWEYVGDYEFSIKKGQVVGEKSKDHEPLTQEDMKWFIYL